MTISAVGIRLAREEDADEILRLAYLMWDAMGISGTPGAWEETFRDVFRASITNGTMRAYVADDPNAEGRLVACGVAVVYTLLPAFWLQNGKMGFLQWFYTDDAWRGRGIASSILESCMEFLQSQGCMRIQLHASPKAMPLYERLGFEGTTFDNMWWSPEGG